MFALKFSSVCKLWRFHFGVNSSKGRITLAFRQSYQKLSGGDMRIATYHKAVYCMSSFVPALFNMPLHKVIVKSSCSGNTRYLKNISDGNIPFIISYRYFLYILWYYCYSCDNVHSIFHPKIIKSRNSKIHTFLFNRCDTCSLADM